MPHALSAEQTCHPAPEADSCRAEARRLLVAEAHFRNGASFEAIGLDVVDGLHVVDPFSRRRDVAARNAGDALTGNLQPGFRLGSCAADGPAFHAWIGTCDNDVLPDDHVVVGSPDAVHALRRGRTDAGTSPAGLH